MIYNLFRIAVTSFFAVLLLQVLGSIIESRFYPVVSNFQIEETLSISTGWSEVYGNFEKLRDCPLEQVSMYYSPSENYELPIQYVWKGPPVVRYDGIQTFGPWEIQVPDTEINKVKVVSRHTCHFMYDTITISYFVTQ